MTNEEKINLVKSDLKILNDRLDCLNSQSKLDWLDSLLKPIVESEIENNEKILAYLEGDETIDMIMVSITQDWNFKQLSWLTSLYRKEGRYPF